MIEQGRRTADNETVLWHKAGENASLLVPVGYTNKTD